MIKRKLYLDKIRSNYLDDYIKVLIGMRGTGKSTLMLQIMDELDEQGVLRDNIIYINFESMKYDELRDYNKLYKYLSDVINTDELYYIFLDEIQNVDSFEKVVASI